ncbi:transposase [Euzebya sp.]|uniref:transposase n=1 Tax=Euzebya sp. TaxID=1971409 RepID=UPI00351655F0
MASRTRGWPCRAPCRPAGHRRRSLPRRNPHPAPHRHRRSRCRREAAARRGPAQLAAVDAADKTATLLRRVRPVSVVDAQRRDMVREMLADWRWLNGRIPPAEDRLIAVVAAHGTTLTSIYGIADIGAATIISIVGDVSRFPTAGHFAAFCGTAPLEASSGDVVRHRLSRRGDRQMNKVLHVAATCQARNASPGRVYYLRKIAEGNGKLEALRKLKRQLATVVYRRLLADQAVRGGQVKTRPKSA